MKLILHLIGTLGLLSTVAATSVAADTQREETEFFERRIRPVLVESCYECHNSGGRAEGGLELDHRSGLLRGGDRGPAIVAGKAGESLLIQAIRQKSDDLRMPQGGPKLKPTIVADFVHWIDHGAVDPRDKPPTKEELAKETSWETTRGRRRQWWSFQPLKLVDPPAVTGAYTNRVDRFLAARWKEVGLIPASVADRRTLLRRLTFVLTGLPPTPAQIEAFLQDSSPDAYERLVDRLMASPAFGERWARHWMDWFRYAETHGSEGDPPIPDAWRYRDYLIRALNADVRYDQLVREHVAGDLLPQPRINRELGINESALGIGHYRMVQHGYLPTDALDELVRTTDNQIDTLSKALLGMTLACARCHDHKFDPLSQKDFYGWYGILASCRPAVITVDTPERREQNRAELVRLKAELRRQLAEVWLRDMDGLAARLEKLPPPSSKATRDKQAQAAKQKNPQDKAPSIDARQLAVDDASVDQGRSPLGAWLALRDKSGEVLSREWQKLDQSRRDFQAKHASFTATRYPLHYDLHGADGRHADSKPWFRDGEELAGRSSVAGEFAILPDGEQVLANVYPTGVFSHLLSSKHGGVLESPRFPIDCDEIWVRVAGGGEARVRYVVQNYVRAMIIYDSFKPQSEPLKWQRLRSSYWKGEHAHIEIATADDWPTDQPPDADRSWFGIVEVVGRNAGQPEPVDLGASLLALLNDATPPRSVAELTKYYARALRMCVEAWRSEKMTDTQAEFMGCCVRAGLLANTLAELPTIASTVDEYRRLEREIRLPTRAPGVREGTPFDQPLLVRGNHRQPSTAVPRRFLEVFDATPYRTRQSGRLELATSLSDPRNPLVSRVIVNRLWHHLFGVGLVPTTDNFGRLGEEPSHPELLDYLAAQFSGQTALLSGKTPDSASTSLRPWSLKDMIRLLVTSQAFRLSSHASPEAAERDPNNRLWSHFRVRRLEAEEIRDALLVVAGKLDPQAGGPGASGQSRRRSVYVEVRRNALDPLLSVFDAPEPNMTLGRRDSTNVPAQSLTPLLNDRFVIDLAKQWADSIAGPGATAASMNEVAMRERISRMFVAAIARPPSADELNRSLAYLRGEARLDAEAQQELARLTVTAAAKRKQMEALVAPSRDRILALRREKAPHTANARTANAALPSPVARWEFDVDLHDSIGALSGQAKGNAIVAGGALVLDGRSYVEVSPLPCELREKTLEVWVQCANLDQRGGGVMSVQSLNGSVFDAIVFAEKDRRHWLAGSNGFVRTRALDGPPESEADQQPVHLAITYGSDGKITAYRNGQPYGHSYVSERPITFPAERSSMLFGLRHSPAGGNKFFAGRILRAQLYDRALDKQQIAASFRGFSDYVHEEELLAGMTPQQHAEYHALQAEMKTIDARSQKLAATVSTQGPGAEWRDLSQSLFNLKEFIYVR